MKKNGFIATSILYSFFLVFVSLFVALISAYLHNRILLQKLSDSAWDTLVGINNTTIGDLKVGDYIEFATYGRTEDAVNSNAKWIVAYIDDVNNKVYFLSDNTAANQYLFYKGTNDLVSKVHLLTPMSHVEALEQGVYQKGFLYDGFNEPDSKMIVRTPTLTDFINIRSQTLSNKRILESIYKIGQDSFIVKSDSSINGFQPDELLEMRLYNFTEDIDSSKIASYCGGSLNGENASYDSLNTYGYINVADKISSDEKFVDFCLYASSSSYQHNATDKVVQIDENKPSGDKVVDGYSLNYSYRLIIEASGDALDAYIAGGKGLYMDPYLFTDGRQQS